MAKLRRCLQTLIYHMFLSNIFNKAETFFPMNYEKWGALYITCCADRFICIRLQGYNVLFRKMILFTNKSIIWSYFGYIWASWNIFIQNILTVKNWNSLCFWYKYIIYRSSKFNSTFHLIYYLYSMWHTQNFVNYITICRLLMLKRKKEKKKRFVP